MSLPASVGNGMPYGLTRQELRMLRLLCDGMCNKDMAEACGIAEDTAKRHLWKMFQKIGVSSRLEAAMFAVAKGLISVDLTGEYARRDQILIEIEECHRKIEKYVSRSRMLVQQIAAQSREAK